MIILKNYIKKGVAKSNSLVGMTGFEPATTRPPGVYATGLRYIPFNSFFKADAKILYVFDVYNRDFKLVCCIFFIKTKNTHLIFSGIFRNIADVRVVTFISGKVIGMFFSKSYKFYLIFIPFLTNYS